MAADERVLILERELARREGEHNARKIDDPPAAMVLSASAADAGSQTPAPTSPPALPQPSPPGAGRGAADDDRLAREAAGLRAEVFRLETELAEQRRSEAVLQQRLELQTAFTAELHAKVNLLRASKSLDAEVVDALRKATTSPALRLAAPPSSLLYKSSAAAGRERTREPTSARREKSDVVGLPAPSGCLFEDEK